MRKILALISFMLFIAVGLQAQVKTVAASFGNTYSMDATASVLKLTPAAGDTINGADVAFTKYYTIKVNTSKLYLFTAICKLDTIKTHHRVLSNHVWVQVYGSLTNPTGLDGWVAIGNPVKFGATVDSTFSYSDVSTGVLYPYLKFAFSGRIAAKCSKPVSFAVKVYPK